MRLLLVACALIGLVLLLVACTRSGEAPTMTDTSPAASTAVPADRPETDVDLAEARDLRTATFALG